MSNKIKIELSEDELEEVKELISFLLTLSREERLVLLSNANAFKTLRELEKLRDDKKESFYD